VKVWYTERVEIGSVDTTIHRRVRVKPTLARDIEYEPPARTEEQLTIVRRRRSASTKPDTDPYQEHLERTRRTAYGYERLCCEAEVLDLVVSLDKHRLSLWLSPPPRRRTRLWDQAHRLVPVGQLIAEVAVTQGNIDDAACRLRAYATYHEQLPEIGSYSWQELGWDLPAVEVEP
jgi:hypothetical protein